MCDIVFRVHAWQRDLELTTPSAQGVRRTVCCRKWESVLHGGWVESRGCKLSSKASLMKRFHQALTPGLETEHIDTCGIIDSRCDVARNITN